MKLVHIIFINTHQLQCIELRLYWIQDGIFYRNYDDENFVIRIKQEFHRLIRDI